MYVTKHFICFIKRNTNTIYDGSLYITCFSYRSYPCSWAIYGACLSFLKAHEMLRYTFLYSIYEYTFNVSHWHHITLTWHIHVLQPYILLVFLSEKHIKCFVAYVWTYTFLVSYLNMNYSHIYCLSFFLESAWNASFEHIPSLYHMWFTFDVYHMLHLTFL